MSNNMKKKQILSCIQPTGEMHLGNYFGAIKNWVTLQKEFDCIYGVVDYHAMTMPYEPHVLRHNTISMMVDLIACGIAPENLFIQSMVPEHTELSWILGCATSYGELSRQVQFKDKSAQSDDVSQSTFVSSGLFTYPVLQAADILMYHADLVPVGKDQEQHLELSRNIASRFNHMFKCEYFKEPQCLFTDIPKLMSLADPMKKMSKSLGDRHIIGLFEDENSIRSKVRQAVTANDNNPDEMSAGVSNIFELLKACENNEAYESLMNDFNRGSLKYVTLKDALASTLIDLTGEFRRSRNSLLGNRDLVEKRVLNSSIEIREKAKKTLREVKQIVGLVPKF
jgi:tryptophanyl-tRNA synthetase